MVMWNHDRQPVPTLRRVNPSELRSPSPRIRANLAKTIILYLIVAIFLFGPLFVAMLITRY